MYYRQEVIEEDKEDGFGNRGPREQANNEYSAELKAYLDEFKQALDGKNDDIKRELWSLKEEVKKASEVQQTSIRQAQSSIEQK